MGGYEIELIYADGFAGRDYYLIVSPRGRGIVGWFLSLGGAIQAPMRFSLNDENGVGSPSEAERCRDKAEAILKERFGLDLDLSNLAFRSAGTM